MTNNEASSISVTVRVRPFTIREAAQLSRCDDGPLFLGDGSLAAAPTPKLFQKGIRSVIKVVDDKCLVFDPPEDSPVQRFSKSLVPQGRRVKDQTFVFDRVFDENINQADVYEATTKSLLDSVLDGYNATVFAYGATGCGKTHTITGTAQQPGIIFLTMQELFERIQDVQEDKVTEISLSYLEIYNETIRDLLLPGTCKQGLMLREDANQTVSVAGLSSHHPQNVQEVMDMIVRGNECRTMSPTEANATSSRSHAVLQINVSRKDRNADVNEPHTMATLSIIDLAGSERASATKNRGERLIEGANINKSLLALGSCINALCDPRQRNHVPYRNSKLTRLLKFSLGGNCKTVMIVCVSPSSAHFDETQNTLRYANRAKNIQTKVTRNVYNVNRHVKDFLKKIDEQIALINELKQQQKEYEAIAFAKYKKQEEKKESVLKEGLTRIRLAYEHSSTDRRERISHMRKARQIERRIFAITAWTTAFEAVCEAREDEEPPRSLAAMKKMATGILAELESSRQHYQHKKMNNNWERALDSALQTGVRQLSDVCSEACADDANELKREVELLKSMAEREAFMEVAEQDKNGDAALLQVLLQAHFETVAIITQILIMDEREAVIAAKNVLGKLINSCSEATVQVIKPDAKLPLVEAFPPTRAGTPKRRTAALLMGPSPVKLMPRLMESMQLSSSPMRASPKRRKVGGLKKGAAFTPRRRSPIKGLKRGVRWRDDTEEGALAEFQATPEQPPSEASPSEQAGEEATQVTPTPPQSDFIPPPPPPPPTLPEVLADEKDIDSSPTPAPPDLPSDLKPRASRFTTGFLAKKSETSPRSRIPGLVLSDSDTSPLQEIGNNRAPYRSPLRQVDNASSDVTAGDSTANSGSSDEDRPWIADEQNVRNLRAALKRTSSSSSGRVSVGGTTRAGRGQRRRSPTSSSPTSPPLAPRDGSPSAGDFAASAVPHFLTSQARRKSKLGGDGWKPSVLSPRTGPIVKAVPARRTTLGEDRIKEGAGLKSGAARLSTVIPTALPPGRGSLLLTSKGTWR